MNVVVIDGFGQDCITREDGQRLYEMIHPDLRAGTPVELDFQGVTVFASPFLNSAIGQLLRDIEPSALNRFLKVMNLSTDGAVILRRVIENAKEYYSDPAKRRAIDDTLRQGDSTD